MVIKQGDIIRLDGVESAIETSWNQGRHKVFKLADQRTIIDLDKFVENGQAEIVLPVVKQVKPSGFYFNLG
jgi:hypothetical protein